jgi:hypothetical protein
MTVDKLAVNRDGIVTMREYRLWVSDDRCLLVRLWNDLGKGEELEVATRKSPYDTWGPPIRLSEEVIK